VVREDAQVTTVAPASFADLVQAQFESSQVPAGGAHSDVGVLRQAFVEHFGPIVLARFGTRTPCGVALTDLGAAPRSKAQSSVGDRIRRRQRGERHRVRWNLRRPVRLHLVFPPLSAINARDVQFLARCEKQAIYARRFLQDEDLTHCLTLLYQAADAVVALADRAEAPAPEPSDSAAVASSSEAPAVEDSAAPVRTTEPTPPAAPTTESATHAPDEPVDPVDPYEVVNEQLAQADQYYQYFTQRAVRIQYIRGIGMGTAAIALLFVVLYVFRGAFHAPIGLLWAILAGALGALTSVLSRATFGRIVLDRAQGGTWNTLLGGFRPLIGSLFGAAFFALINAGFLPIKVPGGGDQIALYASVAFLAGFSHRWAQDTLKAAEAKIPTPSAPQEVEGDSVVASTSPVPTGSGAPKA
jgi:hypothetical protein